MQLPFHITATPTVRPWLDVSEVAHGIGFTTTVEISPALHDALRPRITQGEACYDQRVYDALWLAHHTLSLDARSDFCILFHCLREDKLHGRFNEESLRLRVIAGAQLIQLDLCPHASEAPHGDLSR